MAVTASLIKPPGDCTFLPIARLILFGLDSHKLTMTCNAESRKNMSQLRLIPNSKAN